MVRYAGYDPTPNKPHKYSIPLTDSMLCTYTNNILVKFKLASQTARPLKNLPILKAEKFLNDVLFKKQCVPVTFKKVRRTAQTNTYKYLSKGKWPRKVSRVFLDLIENLKNEADKKGYEYERVRLVHIQVNKAKEIYGRVYKAFGRVAAYNRKPCHIEIAAEYVPKKAEN